MKKIGILGSTGSIGTQTLQVIDQLPGKFDLKYLTAHQNVDLLADQALQYQPDTVCIVNEKKKGQLEDCLSGSNIRIIAGHYKAFFIGKSQIYTCFNTAYGGLHTSSANQTIHN